MAHAVFHRRLVGAVLIVTALKQRFAASVHALGDFVVFCTGFHIGRALGHDELALERCDFFRVEKLHHVQGLLRAQRVERGHHKHMRIPLQHDVGVEGEPDGAMFGQLFVGAEVEYRLMPFAVHRAARVLQTFMNAHGLHAPLRRELPLQHVAIDELAQPGVEGHDVVVLQIDLDEGLPVVVAHVHFGVVVHKAGEVELLEHGQLRHGLGHGIAVVLEQHAVPALQRVGLQMQAGVLLEVRGADELTVETVGPAMQRAHDILARAAHAAQHHGLPVAADVGEQFNAFRPVNQRAAFTFLGERGVVADLGYREFMSEIARAGAEYLFLLQLEQVVIEIG